MRQIKDLMAVMGRTGTKRLCIKKEGLEIEIEREDSGAGQHVLAEEPVAAEPRASKSALSQGGRAPENAKQAAKPAAGDDAAYVTSPIVGVFYPTPGPDEPAFVKVGDRVQKDTVVCIIEAMKVMNEVKAGVSGVLEEVLVDKGHPVEFGSKLFRISK